MNSAGLFRDAFTSTTMSPPGSRRRDLISPVPVTPVGLAVPLVAGFHLVRWVFVVPSLLPVLVGIEYVARRVPHARVLTAIVAFAPMVLWEFSKSPGGFPRSTVRSSA